MMEAFLHTQTAQLVLSISGLCVLSAVGVYVVLKFRDGDDSIDSTSDLLTKFREMRYEGQIDEDEFRTIRADLRATLSTQSSAEYEGQAGKGLED